MNLTHPKYIQLRDLILKSEGRTIEDEIEIGSKISSKEFSLYVDEEGVSEVAMLTWNNDKKIGVLAWRYYTEDFIRLNIGEFMILGRPISIDRVLMALGPTYGYYGIKGGWIDLVDHFSMRLKGGVCRWSLGKPLHEQSEDTWDQLITILS